MVQKSGEKYDLLSPTCHITFLQFTHSLSSLLTNQIKGTHANYFQIAIFDFGHHRHFRLCRCSTCTGCHGRRGYFPGTYLFKVGR